MDQQPQGLRVVNMTNFFNRELFLYSLGDVRLPTPISIKKVAIFGVAFIIWSIPFILAFGLIINLFYIVLLLGPPVLIAGVADKPWFGGRGIVDAMIVTIKYFASPKCYTDMYVSNSHKNTNYFIEQYIWISRRRELQILADLIEKRD